jgi:hypothetical protein
MENMTLPGLERLMEVCQRLNLGLETSPPAREPLKVGALLEGVPLDPMLASVYARLGHASFALKVGGVGLTQSDDQEQRFEKSVRWWREEWWEELGEPVIPFASHVYTYATVPGLADGWGRQPVVEVNTYEYEPRVMPVASNVDRFFDIYSRYLEALIVHPRLPWSSYTELTFPWDVTEVLAQDERLVELMRTRRFDSLMKHVKQSKETQRWFERVAGVPL